jgi:hypothetical protein
VFWLSDDFEDPAFDYGMWHVASHGSVVELSKRRPE